jgi:CMP-N,N'-diacetyllegionaminic acid synthase
MYKQKTYLAIIPARGGSKRLPGKNILDLKGKPLIGYSIEAALESQYVDNVLISSDDDEILKFSQKFEVIAHKRPHTLSTDTSSTVDVVTYIIERYSEYDYIVLLQPTSPLRTAKHIDEAIEMIESKNAEAIISVSEMEHSPLWSSTLSHNKSMRDFIKDEIKNKRSQDLEIYYRINGAIYICNSKELTKQQTFFLEDNIFAYIMTRENSIDIDEKIDFELAKLYMETR